MLNPATVVLRLPLSDRAALAPFVETCLASGISLIAIWGEGARGVEDEIDAIIVGDGSNPDRFMSTSVHGPKDDALGFAMDWNDCAAALVVRL
jgi:hypothetical protein